MTMPQAIRWSGVVTIVVGILLFLFGISPFVFLPTSEPPLAWVRDDQWFVLNLLAFILTLLTPLALVGLYARQMEASGRLGFLGFLLAFIGSLLFAGLQFDEAFVWPILAIEAPSLIDPRGPMFSDPAFSSVYLLMGIVYILGFIFFGIATARAKVLPRWAAILLTVGVPLFAGGFLIPPIVRAIGTTLAAIGLIWMGYALWQEGDRESRGGANRR